MSGVTEGRVLLIPPPWRENAERDLARPWTIREADLDIYRCTSVLCIGPRWRGTLSEALYRDWACAHTAFRAARSELDDDDLAGIERIQRAAYIQALEGACGVLAWWMKHRKIPDWAENSIAAMRWLIAQCRAAGE